MMLYPISSHADMGAEIDHLFEYIEGATCTFYRNGQEYGSQEASAHIRRKYTHIKGRIKTTEEFIRYAATKSSISGQSYQVICDGKTMATAEWLTRELTHFRDRNH